MYNDEFDRFNNTNQYHYGRNSNLPADDYQPAGSTPPRRSPSPPENPASSRPQRRR